MFAQSHTPIANSDTRQLPSHPKSLSDKAVFGNPLRPAQSVDIRAVMNAVVSKQSPPPRYTNHLRCDLRDAIERTLTRASHGASQSGSEKSQRREIDQTRYRLSSVERLKGKIAWGFSQKTLSLYQDISLVEPEVHYCLSDGTQIDFSFKKEQPPSPASIALGDKQFKLINPGSAQYSIEITHVDATYSRTTYFAPLASLFLKSAEPLQNSHHLSALDELATVNRGSTAQSSTPIEADKQAATQTEASDTSRWSRVNHWGL